LDGKGREVKKNAEGGGSKTLCLLRGDVKYKARNVSFRYCPLVLLVMGSWRHVDYRGEARK